jgi:hypothetical protein
LDPALDLAADPAADPDPTGTLKLSSKKLTKFIVHNSRTAARPYNYKHTIKKKGDV